MVLLTHLQLTVNFANQHVSRSISDRLYEALGGKGSGSKVIEPPFRLRSDKDRQLISWDTQHCQIIIEKIDNPDDCIERILELLCVIDKVAPLQKLSDQSLVTHWILPAQKYNNFEALEHTYRGRIIIDNPLWDKVIDSSFMCDMAINGVRLHHQSGPMEPDQFKDGYSSFPIENIPKLFIFWLINVSSDKIIEYSSEEMRKFINVAYEYSKNHSESFERMWEGIV
jgi:hypothetical protein